ncbi:MAG: hypothetical protein KDD43_00050 [Bdellovibrionales bacterium]|nr:hypothetical protein [Bdellovibrionales bacterium]
MAVLTASLPASEDRVKGFHEGYLGFLSNNGEEYYAGGLVGLVKSTGEPNMLDDAADRAYLGRVTKRLTGDGTEDTEIMMGPYIVRDLTVAGYSSAAKNWEPVYAPTDNPGTKDTAGDLTLTRPADDAVLVGFTVRYRSSNKGDVLFIGGLHAAIMSMSSGKGKELVFLGSYPGSATTAANLAASIILYGHGKITGFYAISDGDMAGSSAAATVNLELGGTNLTGGVISLTEANTATQGAKVSASAITDGNEFFDGDSLDVEYTVSSAFSAGRFMLFMEIERLP